MASLGYEGVSPARNNPRKRSPTLFGVFSDEAGVVATATAGRCLDAFVEEVIKSLKRDDTVNLVGFGSFSVKKRAARDGRNPRTGDPIKIAAANVPSFRAGKTFKDSIQ